MKTGFSIWNASWRSWLKPRTNLSHSLKIGMTWWFSILLFRGPFKTPFPPLLSILRYRVLLRRVHKGISVGHSTFKTLISSGGGLLCSASIVYSVGSLLEQELKVDSCCVLVWCIAEWNALLLSPCFSLWCPLVKQHRSPTAFVAFTSRNPTQSNCQFDYVTDSLSASSTIVLSTCMQPSPHER